MRKVIGIGETVLDVIFKDNQPFKAVPGGSTFNCMISLSRCKVPAFFVSEIGNDKIGSIVKDFMDKNGLSHEYVGFYENGSSPVALAFLNDLNNAEYIFYHNFPKERLEVDFPSVEEGDIVVFGSYFAVNPILREKVQSFLEYAKEKRAVIYYDINFRKAHAHEVLRLETSFIENYEYSDIIRCSDEDLSVLYPKQQIDDIYKNYIAFYTRIFIVTTGSGGVLLKTADFSKHYPVPSLTTASTIGAGDNFNAGLIYGLLTYNISSDQLNKLSEENWDKIIALAIDFASNVCSTYDNYISEDIADQLK